MFLRARQAIRKRGGNILRPLRHETRLEFLYTGDNNSEEMPSCLNNLGRVSIRLRQKPRRYYNIYQRV